MKVLGEHFNEFGEIDLVIVVCPRCQRQNRNSGTVGVVMTMSTLNGNDGFMFMSSQAPGYDGDEVLRTGAVSRTGDGPWVRDTLTQRPDGQPHLLPADHAVVRCRHGERTILTEVMDLEIGRAFKARRTRVLVSEPPPM